MGVPLLLTWLRRRFSSCFLPSNTVLSTDCLYIDVNGLVYQAAALVTSGGVDCTDIDAAIIQRVFDLLDDIVLKLVRPRSLVYLAVDGVSPMGKLSQQRSRRRRRRRQDPHSQAHGTEWDSNSISVGTSFMSSLANALHFYCVSRTEQVNVERLREHRRRSRPVDIGSSLTEEQPPLITFVVDGVWRPGEGECKITDAIRRFRSQPNYDPNTSHVICSSDTDMTVCSLILHEPHIHVLRYEHAPRGTSKGVSDGWTRSAGDSWASTFFSINAFREELRSRLRLERCANNTDTAGGVERCDRLFESALHDVVFVLLLFGNDFLPSVGCRIEEGFLDSLLEMLATDFVTRGLSIVDPTTNTIQFDSARYALESLAEMRCEQAGGLHVDNGVEGAADWGFVDDKFLARQAEEEAEKAPWCYAYWTMLQWSLQNSAGVVEHWGCYYPYSTAPPLHLLQKYCGTLSYEALMELARKRSLRKRSCVGNTGSKDGAEGLRHELKLRDEGPLDVLVQLLVLLPPRSVALMPTVVRNGYSEIESMVREPVESIDFDAIQAWCATKCELFTEEERARFEAYALAASNRLIAGDEHTEIIRGNEMLFVSYWEPEALEAEQETSKELQRPVNRGSPSTIVFGEAKTNLLNKTASGLTSFFGSRAKPETSAAVAALLTAPKDGNVCAKEVSDTSDSALSETLAPNGAEEGVSQNLLEVLTLSRDNFTLHTVSISALGDEVLARRFGVINGDTFSCGLYKCGSLSRNRTTMHVRLQWRIASRPLRGAAAFKPYLLLGLEPSPHQRVVPEDVNGAIGGVKRPLSEVGSLSDDGGDTNVEMLGGCGSPLPETKPMDLLRERKEALRRRLELLQGRDGTAEESHS
uniref:Putative exoribonuclease 2 n=1 Tax=Trypanosoma congolense (strain IL3000) TaxID=1068625 RepID=G0URP2_TRYCI|nr:putative exoribonuclease 2 [Trypanosoma congolense IL3000]